MTPECLFKSALFAWDKTFSKKEMVNDLLLTCLGMNNVQTVEEDELLKCLLDSVQDGKLLK